MRAAVVAALLGASGTWTLTGIRSRSSASTGCGSLPRARPDDLLASPNDFVALPDG